MLNTVWTAIMEIARGIDLKLKNEKTPRERFMWWVIILLIIAIVIYIILQQLGAFFISVIKF